MIHTRHVVALFVLLGVVLLGVLAYLSVSEKEEVSVLPEPVFGTAAETYGVAAETIRNSANVRESLTAKLRGRDIPDKLEEEEIEETETLEEVVDATSSLFGETMLLDYMPDGFAIYSGIEFGRRVEAADLDSCGGHKHSITVGDQNAILYHYHVVAGVPLRVGCEPGVLTVTEEVPVEPEELPVVDIATPSPPTETSGSVRSLQTEQNTDENN